MDPARWQRIESICFDALERDAASRAAFLVDACAGDDELHAEARSLLHQLERDPHFLTQPLVDLSALSASPRENAVSAHPREPDPEPAPVAAIGPYRVLRRLGRGGMGELFLALRRTEDIEQRVAVKVIRRGMDTDEVLRRFRLERRILASLEHPNIARFLDAAATDDGRPYVVMEYVEGEPIDEYCDGNRLGIRGRLDLFLSICGAVQHAHQNLVVHRDIKPRNILVTAQGVPKLLDFGIGKVLAPVETLEPGLETRTHVRLLTPEYAAPEQVTGGPVTTATDVYGLGILLYELLAGVHPYLSGGETGHEVERAVLEATPRRPSEAVSFPSTGQRDRGNRGTASEISTRRATDPGQLRRRLAGDLDTIVLQALRKEPERRYPSAAALAEDIRRHLDGLPVAARGDTLGYRARKFVRRNAAWVTVGVVAFLALGATSAVTVVQSRRVAREAERVAQERDKALEVRSFLMEMFGASGASRAVGDTVTARRLLDLQAVTVDSAYAGRPQLRADMLEVLADGYDRLGLYQSAEPLAKQALDLRRGTLPAGHADIAAALNLYGWIVHELGRSADAEPLLREAIDIRRAGGTTRRTDLSRSLNDLGVVLQALGRHADAEAVLSEALEIRRAALGDEHRAVGITASNLAASYYFQSRFDDAVRTQELAVRVLRKAVGPDHQRSIIALGNAAAFKVAAADWDGAIGDYRDLLERQTRLQGAEHPVTARVKSALASALFQSGFESGDTALLATAERLYEEALGNFGATLGPAHPQVGATLTPLAQVRLELGRADEALATGERALAILRAALGDTHQSTAGALAQVAMINRRMNQPDRAVALQRDAVHAFETALGSDHPETAKMYGTLCEMLLESGRPEEAERHCTRADATLRKAGHRYRHEITLLQIWSARVQQALGRHAIADSLAAEARRGVDSGLGGWRARQQLEQLSASLAAPR